METVAPDFDATLLDAADLFDGQSAGSVEGRPLFARLLDAVVDADLPGEWGAGSGNASTWPFRPCLPAGAADGFLPAQRARVVPSGHVPVPGTGTWPEGT